MPLLVYALADRWRSRRRLRGIEGEPLHIVTVGKISAVIGSVPRSPVPTTESVQQYDAVLRTLALATTALLPARFATTLTGRSEIEDVLRERQQFFARALRHVRGRVQMTVRVIETSRGAGEPPGGSVACPGQLRHDEVRLANLKMSRSARRQPISRSAPLDGASYLRERAAEAARARRVPGFDAVRAAVQPFIRDERVDKRGAVASVYHLIPRASAPSYRRALEGAARHAGLRVIVSGPWPPYAFVEA